MDMVVPCLGDKGDDVGIRFQKARKARIIGRGSSRPLGHSESRKTRAVQFRAPRKKFRIERIGAGIASLDVVNAKSIEHGRDMALVGERKIDARRLRAVAQGGVKEGEPFAGHFGRSFWAKSRKSRIDLIAVSASARPTSVRS